MDHPIITRAEAKAAGLTRYFTDKPCPNGHTSERIVKCYSCVKCQQAQSAAYRARNPSKVKEQRAEYYSQNKEREKTNWATYRAHNIEKIKEREATYRARSREKIKTSWATYYTSNAEKQRASTAIWRAENPEKRKAMDAAWRAGNPEKAAAKDRNQNARRKKAEGHHAPEDIHRIYDAQNGKCACCKEKVGKKYHIDHIQPLSKGGSNFAKNVQILCPTCNMSKSNKDPITFMQSLGMLL